MAAWMLPSTGSPRTLTDTWTSDRTIHPMSGGDWSSACMTEQGACHRAGHLAEGRVPPHQSPEAEHLPQCFHPLLISTFCS